MKKKKENSIFKYIVIAAVLIIPFMYSFFYLKAYWNPYGEGNIDNIPVAIINQDKGDKGKALVKSIEDSKKLKISVVTEEKANDGLNNGDYYAIISIPKTFTSDMESAKNEVKHHAMITYSPNQKSNYLASQIINNVVNVVEKNLDNQVNKQIVSTLTNKLNEVPESLETIENGFSKLEDGSNQLKEGSLTLNNGITSLKENYSKFHNGITSISNGLTELNNATSNLSMLNDNMDTLITGVSTIKNGEDYFNSKLNAYIDGVQTELNYTNNMSSIIVQEICPKVMNGTATQNEVQLCGIANGLSTPSNNFENKNLITYLQDSGNLIKDGSSTVQNGIAELNAKVSGLSKIKPQIAKLQSGVQTLKNGSQTLYNSSIELQNGINQLSSGSNTLYQGISTLNSSIVTAKDELNINVKNTKKELKKLDGLSNYSEEPVKINTKEVNKVSSYGTAFSPFFISIALWVGSLMMFIVLYYDKANRFGILGIENQNRIQRTLAYHGLATLSSIILGILLYFLLDFEITNIFLYFLTIIITSNAFMAIIEFLIGNFQDIGKFIALILLVLQLAAAGGTFPIETVTKGFRWMHNLLPMTYTVRLLREPLVSIQSNLLVKNLIIVIAIFVVFFTINIVMDIYKQKKH